MPERGTDSTPVTVTAQTLAVGLAALHCPIWQPRPTSLGDLSASDTELYLSEARFVLGVVGGGA